jgi:short-subunit dehydrogenase
MSTAIVTGGSSGIGLAISKMLKNKGYDVYSLSRNKAPDPLINHIEMDLSKIEVQEHLIKGIYKKYKDLKVLVHSAGQGIFGLHEELNPSKLNAMMQINFVAPVIITRHLLRTIKQNQGWIVFISSIVSDKISPLAAAYSGTKSGISQFAKSIWEESRKSGLRVVNLQPDMTESNFYKQNWFDKDDDIDSYLKPDEIAEILSHLMDQRTGINITELKIQPRLHKIQKKKLDT